MPPFGPPKAPKTLSVTAVTPTTVDLAWVDRANNEASYTVQRAPDGVEPYLWTSSTVAKDKQTYKVSKLLPNLRYRFRVRAENAQGVSDWSNVVLAQTPDLPNQGPVADLRLIAAPAGEPVLADLRGSYDPDGELVSGRLTWGDGTASEWTGAIATVEHIYAAEGTYEVTLVITDEDGMPGTLTASLTVMPPIALPPPPTPPPPVEEPPPAPQPPPVVDPLGSPTGYEPHFIWTRERQGVWNQMKLDFEANPAAPATLGGQWYKVIKGNADLSGTANARYYDVGSWATLMYQITGEVSYVEKAWAQLQGFLTKVTSTISGDHSREFGIDYLIICDWLWPGLTAARRDQFEAKLADLINHTYFGHPGAGSGLPRSDSDQLTSNYLAALMFIARFPTNPTAQTIAAFATNGGLVSTGADKTTYRNTIRLYTELLAAGGEWIESGQYNLNTPLLMFLGTESLKTYYGVDYFPEVTAWYSDFGKSLLTHFGPGLEMASFYQWGDEEHARNVPKFRLTQNLGAVAGLLQNTLVGQQAHQLLIDLVAQYGAVGYNTMEPVLYPRGLFFFNPYASHTDWRTEANNRFTASGMGLMLHRSGYDPEDSLMAVHAGNRPIDATGVGQVVEHHVEYLNDIELWKNGEWALTHSRGYAGPPYTGFGSNAVLMHGFSEMARYKVGVAEQGTDYTFVDTTTGGSAVPAPYYDPPPIFCHEWTRGVLYVAGETDTIIVYDRAHLDPVARLDRYYAAQQDRIAFFDAIHPKLWNLHSPVAPTIGTDVRWTPLLPAVRSLRTYDINAEVAANTPYGRRWVATFPVERKHNTFLHPGVTQAWDTFLNVIQAGTPVTPSLIQVAGEVEGVAVARSGAEDVVLLFNAKPGPRLATAAFDAAHLTILPTVRLRSTGYSVSIPVVGASAFVFLVDLNPATVWTVSIDGAAAVALTVSARGLARLTLTGAGTHTLAVSAA
jgi:hypothetical protein